MYRHHAGRWVTSLIGERPRFVWLPHWWDWEPNSPDMGVTETEVLALSVEGGVRDGRGLGGGTCKWEKKSRGRDRKRSPILQLIPDVEFMISFWDLSSEKRTEISLNPTNVIFDKSIFVQWFGPSGWIWHDGPFFIAQAPTKCGGGVDSCTAPMHTSPLFFRGFSLRYYDYGHATGVWSFNKQFEHGQMAVT